jgi:hypothetical protein
VGRPLALRRDFATRIALAGVVIIGLAAAATAQQTAAQPKPGVAGVQVPFARLKPVATFTIGETADWVMVTDDAAWVVGTKPYSLQRIDPATNRVVAKIRLSGEACSGLAYGFGSVWVPVCGDKGTLARVDVQTNRIAAVLPITPGGPEGGIAASRDSVWLVKDKAGTTLSRINPATNTVRQTIAVPAGSYNPVASGGRIWITGVESNVLTAVDAESGVVVASIPVGPRPRFLAAGGGAVWTLNQGDGSVTRVDEKSRKVTATIALGIPGAGGDLGYGAGAVWATTFDVPLTMVDGKTNRVTRQWVGQGGRFAADWI